MKFGYIVSKEGSKAVLSSVDGVLQCADVLKWPDLKLLHSNRLDST